MLKRVTLTSIFLAAVIPAIGLMANSAWPLAMPCIGMGGLWLVGCCQGRDALASWLLVGFFVLAALGVGMSGGAVWAPPAVVMALAAWDLHRFMERVRGISTDAASRDLERRHLRRLLAVSGLGLGLGWVAAGAHLTLSFGMALALGFLAILGVSQVVRALVREKA